MQRCPTCRAGYAGGTECYRCKTDLSGILGVEREAERCRIQAAQALARRNLAMAAGYADRGLFLHRSPAMLRVAAMVALARRDFRGACVLWREVKAAGRSS